MNTCTYICTCTCQNSIQTLRWYFATLLLVAFLEVDVCLQVDLLRLALLDAPPLRVYPRLVLNHHRHFYGHRYLYSRIAQ
eukprot:m.70928 g.70928  ORF g.70928 m.70928 type:complete len:80 (+) comp12273_c0_seq5:1358-1597(+)